MYKFYLIKQCLLSLFLIFYALGYQKSWLSDFVFPQKLKFGYLHCLFWKGAKAWSLTPVKDFIILFSIFCIGNDRFYWLPSQSFYSLPYSLPRSPWERYTESFLTWQNLFKNPLYWLFKPWFLYSGQLIIYKVNKKCPFFNKRKKYHEKTGT